MWGLRPPFGGREDPCGVGRGVRGDEDILGKEGPPAVPRWGVGHLYGVTACVMTGNPFLLTEGYGMRYEDPCAKGTPHM